MASLPCVETCPECYGSGLNIEPDQLQKPRCKACGGNGRTPPLILEWAKEKWEQMQACGAFTDVPSLIGLSYEEFKINDPIGASEFEASL